ncbi:MAG TPA: beta-ketoacyl-ACP synthase II [Verrucomicrobiae bacterium]|nr:beta-ketoacyl-ACP synthase II [Verrucomicrobiae bacterium]
MSLDRRIVVTGLGAITPVGKDVGTYWDALVNGRSGAGPITAFDASAFDCRIAAEVKGFEPALGFKNPKDARRADRYTQLAVAAAKQAVADAGLADPAGLDLDRIGVMIGSGIGGLITLENQHSVYLEKGPGRLSPFLIPMLIGNIASGIVAMEHGFRGPNLAVVTACATSAQCIGEAWRIIRDGDADVIVAGGSEAAICPMGIGGFAAMRAVSFRNDAPEQASRPWDTGRDGFLMGEGSGMVVIETLEHAKKRGAKIYCELAGYGLSADAYHLSAPDPDGAGAARAMAGAIKRAGVALEEVGYINAHGTSTPLGDICETLAIKSVFGDHAKKVPVSSTKSMIGHLLGAAGAVEAIVCVKTIETGIIHPTINLNNPDPKCDLDYVPNQARQARVNVAMSNSFGFGGHNSCLVLKRI